MNFKIISFHILSFLIIFLLSQLVNAQNQQQQSSINANSIICMPYCLQCQSSITCLKCQKGKNCCPYYCQNCSIQDNITCLQCMPGTTLNQTQNLCYMQDACNDEFCSSCTNTTSSLYFTQICQQCSPLYYYHQDINICLECSSNCIQCKNYSYCQSCIPSFYYNLQTNLCDMCQSNCFTCTSYNNCQQCAQRMYFNESNQLCQQCGLNCVTCINSLICTSCQILFYLVSITNNNNTQIEAICLPCSSTCLSCQNQSTYCTYCITGKFLNPENNTCMPCESIQPSCQECSYQQNLTIFQDNFICSLCKIGNFLNNETNICESCFENCISCHQYNQCDICQNGFYLTYNAVQNGSKIYLCSQCPNGCSICYEQICQLCKEAYYMNQNHQCQNCIQNCKKCTSYQNCYQCKQNYYIVYQKTNQTVDQQGLPYITLCLPCNPYCEQCNYTTNQCTACKKGYFHIQQLTPCTKCKQQCYQCENMNKCTSCSDGYYLNDSNYTCLPCSSNCKKCQNNKSCSQCFESYSLNNQQLFICTPCLDPNCAVCDQDPSNCMQCKYSYYFNINSTTNIQCQKCQVQNCKICFNLGSVCMACFDNALLANNSCLISNNCKTFDLSYPTQNSLNICSSCYLGYYLNISNQCLQCPLECETCQIFIQDQLTPSYIYGPYCTSCKIGFYLTSSNFFASPKSQCLKCNQRCQICQSYQLCLQCISSQYNLINYYCQKCQIDSCLECDSSFFKCIQCDSQKGYILNQGGTCYKCQQNELTFGCLQCNQYYRCSSCKEGYQLIFSQNKQQQKQNQKDQQDNNSSFADNGICLISNQNNVPGWAIALITFLAIILLINILVMIGYLLYTSKKNNNSDVNQNYNDSNQRYHNNYQENQNSNRRRFVQASYDQIKFKEDKNKLTKESKNSYKNEGYTKLSENLIELSLDI